MSSDSPDRVMIPLGYMAKQAAPAPPIAEWLGLDAAESICSVSTCMSPAFTDYIDYWLRNEHWFFDSPEPIMEIATVEEIAVDGLRWFYYEAFVDEYRDDRKYWKRWKTDGPGDANVQPPASKKLLGFDVVEYSFGTLPACSPLTCNGLFKEIPVNDCCLFDSFDAARKAIEAGAFENSEPGPYRIIAVYAIEP